MKRKQRKEQKSENFFKKVLQKEKKYDIITES